MSTIPTLNPQMAMTTGNMKSKTNLTTSSVGGLAPITIKSNRTRVSPFRADPKMLSTELQKFSKDQTRENFTAMINNLPSIKKKKSTATRADSLYQTSTSTKRVHRKDAVPPASIATKRTTKSMGGHPGGIDTEGSIVEMGSTTAYTANISVTKASKSSNPYPSYFYTPKDNLFEKKRLSSRYDQGLRQQQ